MIAYATKRLVLTLLVLWGVGTLVFGLLRLAPGDPAEIALGINATSAQIASFRQQNGLDLPLLLQYGRFLADAGRLHFGQSIIADQEAGKLVVERLPSTIQLAVAAMLIGLAASFPLGVAAARKPGSRLDRAISLLSISGQSLPSFWVGVMLILLFSRNWGLFPSGGSGSLSQLVLPAVTLSAPLTGLLIRLVRSGLLEVSHEPFLQTARSKGLTERAVLLHHAIPNMLIPVVTVAGLQFGKLLGGAVVVEVVFAWPGIGQLLVDSIQNRDYAVVQACTFVIAAMFLLLNLAVDLSYPFLDPRARLSG